MNLYLKTMLILFGLAYLISPVDIIPDLLLPYFGWIDDGLVLFTVFHLIRHGELPWFLFKQKRVKENQKSPGNQERTFYKDQSAERQAPFKDKRKEKRKQSDFENGSHSSKSAREILEVADNAGWEEIYAAYKAKIKQYHPDKVSHLGEEFSHLANEKFLEIQKAYGELKKQRSL